MQKHFLFVSSFEHVIFQTYKNAILKSVHSLGWFQVDCDVLPKNQISKFLFYFISYDVMLKYICAKKLYVTMY
jgi:hypothetical protein